SPGAYAFVEYSWARNKKIWTTRYCSVLAACLPNVDRRMTGRVCLKHEKSDDQDNLSYLFSGVHHGVRLASLLQRKSGMYDGTYFFAFQQRPDVFLERLCNVGLKCH